ncbi:MAG: NADH-ubiquinone oxidoreductase-F iron-sulfur binding region domain-containing protein [Pseudomonadota bacterium]
MPEAKYRIECLVCAGTSCVAGGSFELKGVLEESIKKFELRDEVRVTTTGCNGFCAAGPIIRVMPDDVFYQFVTPGDVDKFVEEHFIKGRVYKPLLYEEDETRQKVPIMSDIGFFKHQTLIVLRNRGLIDPEVIDEYIGRDGYRAVAKALTQMTPEDIRAEMKKSGLRGRGGAGFPTALKWEFCAKAQGDIKYMLCNADEGDPGAFMDRSVLESDPHAVLEGMTIGAKAIGSSEGYIYVRAEYPLAIKRLQIAIRQALDYGLLGDNILDTGFNFHLDLYFGAGAFVCGEETALMRSIEGKRGTPRPRPPFPAHKGLWDRPSVLNNVETLANVPQIIQNGGDWYASLGTERSKGTKVFALSGAVQNIGLVEIPMGASIRTLVYDIGGGAKAGKQVKAIQMGGPSGGCIPEKIFDTQIDYEEIQKTGAIMGSGGVVVMDDTTCMVDLARFFLDFTSEESCGKCVPCRIGTKVMLDVLDKIIAGNGEMEDLDKLEDLGRDIAAASLCGLGQTAPNPVLSTLRYYRHEYEAHVKEQYCPAGKCKRLSPTPCQAACPIGSDISSYVSLIGHGRYNDALQVILEDNPLPASLGRICVHKCEEGCRRAEVDTPVSICALKRVAVDKVPGYVDDVEPCAIRFDEKVAIVGAGPAGVAAAYDLVRYGYGVTIFDMLKKGGGMLRAGIPEYRLPRKTLDAELGRLVKMGVKFEFGKKLGKDFSLGSLRKQGFKAIFMGIGAYKGMKLRLEGEDEAGGITDCIEFLMENNLKGHKKAGDKVLVIGGGNAAMDAARVSIRVGSDVRLLYRRTRKEMPANPAEIEAAIEEGVNMELLVQPVALLTSSGRVKGLKCIRNELGEPDKSGRRRPVAIEGSEFDVEADAIITAIGQSPDLSFIGSGSGEFELSRWGTIKVDPDTMQTSQKDVFAAGDAVTGPASAVEAMGGGRQAAHSIHCFLRGLPFGVYKHAKPMKFPERVPVREGELDGLEKPKMPHMSVGKRCKCFDEVELGLDEKTAIMEAKRCLRCDLQAEE